MQALTNIAAQLLRQNWSIMEDLFRDATATVHQFNMLSQPATPRTLTRAIATLLSVGALRWGPGKGPGLTLPGALLWTLPMPPPHGLLLLNGGTGTVRAHRIVRAWNQCREACPLETSAGY